MGRLKHKNKPQKSKPIYATNAKLAEIIALKLPDIKISTFMCVTNAKRRGDTYIEAIKTHLWFSDELIVVDGGSTDGTIEEIEAIADNRIKIVTLHWPDDWSWGEFASHWNYGYQHCTGDWVAAGESDHIWTEAEAAKVKPLLQNETLRGTAAAQVDKVQTSLVNRIFSKSRFPYFLNKAKYKDQLGYGLDPNKHTDLAYPILVEKQTGSYFFEGTALPDHLCGFISSTFINYAWTFKSLDQMIDERTKGLKGWEKYTEFKELHGKNYPGGNKDNLTDKLKSTLLNKYERCQTTFPLEKHPQIMQEKILKDLKPGMCGYDLCGLIKETWQDFIPSTPLKT